MNTNKNYRIKHANGPTVPLCIIIYLKWHTQKSFKINHTIQANEKKKKENCEMFAVNDHEKKSWKWEKAGKMTCAPTK